MLKIKIIPQWLDKILTDNDTPYSDINDEFLEYILSTEEVNKYYDLQHTSRHRPSMHTPRGTLHNALALNNICEVSSTQPECNTDVRYLHTLHSTFAKRTDASSTVTPVLISSDTIGLIVRGCNVMDGKASYAFNLNALITMVRGITSDDNLFRSALFQQWVLSIE